MDNGDICNTADRLGVSKNDVTALVSSKLKAGGAGLEKFIISVATTKPSRMMTRYQINLEHIATFSKDRPMYAALYWHDKMLRDTLGSHPGTMLETLVVLVSGPSA